MAKYYGKIGFIETKEVRPGVWKAEVTERNYYGDILRHNKRFDTGQSVNDDLNINNEISIVADPYAYNHFYQMRYIEFCGTLWRVTSVDVQRPRLVLTIGGVYNGEKAETPPGTV